MISRRIVWVVLFLAAAAHAQPYPSKVVRIVVPFPPGGSAEAQTRVLAQKLGELWSQPVIIENRPGAGTTIGAAFVAKAAPDGYTLLMAFMLAHAITANLYKSLPYDAVKGFAAVSMVAYQPFVVAVHPNVKATTLRELIELARAKPDALTYATSGTGAGPHLAGELWRSEAGIKVVHVPFKGASPALTALLGGQVDYSFIDASVLPSIQAGKLRALAVSTATRWSQLPNVPTIAESGFAGYDVTSSGMLLAPAGTPPDVVREINAAVGKALAAPEVRARFAAQGYDVGASTPEALQALIASEVAKYGRIIKELGLTAE